jgi:hypothetical protein
MEKLKNQYSSEGTYQACHNEILDVFHFCISLKKNNTAFMMHPPEDGHKIGRNM